MSQESDDSRWISKNSRKLETILQYHERRSDDLHRIQAERDQAVEQLKKLEEEQREEQREEALRKEENERRQKDLENDSKWRHRKRPREDKIAEEEAKRSKYDILSITCGGKEEEHLAAILFNSSIEEKEDINLLPKSSSTFW